MKIEMGESLLQSYLKHTQKCLVTQTNWKTSSNWIINPESQDIIEYLYEKIRKNNEFSDVFKNNDLTQVLKQAEIDVVGVNGENKLYMVEVAFHEGGLNYGSKIETKNKIFEKLLRALLVATAYFSYEKLEILFASPKTNPSTRDIILDYFEILTREFRSEKVCFKFITNDDFKNEILEPTLMNTNNDSDTSELFLRTYKMLDLFNLIREKENNEEIQIANNKYIVSPETIITKNIPDDNIPLRAEVQPHPISRNIKPEVYFFLNSKQVTPEAFKARLLVVKHATRIGYYENGRISKKSWNASHFKIESNLLLNIQTDNMYKNWRETGLKRVDVIIDE